MDLNGVETINLAALGGADHVVVNDLSGTGVSQVNVALGAAGGAGDAAADLVDVHGSAAGRADRGAGRRWRGDRGRHARDGHAERCRSGRHARGER
jgi:hypothetical protein